MKWIFKENEILRIVLYFKNKEINLKAIKCMNQNTKQNKREQNHKVEFLSTKKIEGENGG